MSRSPRSSPSSASGRASSWALSRSPGSLVGAFLGTRLAPLLLPKGSASPYAPAFGLFGALLAGAILATGLEGLGFRAATHARAAGLGLSTACWEPLLGAALALGIVWIVAAVAAQTPGAGQLRADIQRSAILRELNALLPPSRPDPRRARAPGPAAVDHGPSPNVAPPPPRIARPPGVRAAARSVVRVLGTACGLAIEGSGWVAGAGPRRDQRARRRRRAGHDGRGRRAPAGACGAEPVSSTPTTTSRSCACPGSACRAARWRPTRRPGRAGAILGYPENGPFDGEPARIGRTQRSMTDNAYGHGPVTRLLTPLRGLVRPGNSGGPVVDAQRRAC